MGTKISPEDLFIHPQQWNLRLLNMKTVWEIETGDAEVIIACLDLGFDIAHPNLVSNIWNNPTPSAHGDLHGWDFEDDDNTLMAEVNNPSYWGYKSDYCKNHGTGLLGIAAARPTGREKDICGMAPGCTLMPLRIANLREGPTIRAIRYAMEHGARVLFCLHGVYCAGDEDGSYFYRGTDWSVPESSALKEVCEEAYERGMLLFTGVSDNRDRESLVFPSGYDTFISVASCNWKGERISDSGYGPQTEIMAPTGDRPHKEPVDGVQVDGVYTTAAEDSYYYASGQCAATPHAAALAALIWSHHPEFTNDEARQIIRNTAIGDGWNKYKGHGLINPAAALKIKRVEVDLAFDKDALTLELTQRGKYFLRARVQNRGVKDCKRALMIAYNGNPKAPALPKGETGILSTRQIGNSIFPVMGLESTDVLIELQIDEMPGKVWVELETVGIGEDAVKPEERLASVKK